VLVTVTLNLTYCKRLPSYGSNEQTWAEKLGYPSGKKVIIIHADDAGLSNSVNRAVQDSLVAQEIQSAAAMPPAPEFDAFIEWAMENPDKDIGLHLAFTAEWPDYPWGSVAPPEQVSGLLDENGNMRRSVPKVLLHARPHHIETELRAQIEKSLAMGFTPTHIDTHMGVLYSRHKFLKIFLDIAEEYNIPANAISMASPRVVKKYRDQGAPIDQRYADIIEDYSLPKLDDYDRVPNGKTYAELKANFLELVNALEPGLIEIIFHPMYPTDEMKNVVGSWQRRGWEAELFSDPEVKARLAAADIVLTDWIEIMKRHDNVQ